METANSYIVRPGTTNGPVLDWRMPFIRLFLALLFLFPVFSWLGWTNPETFAPFQQPWPANWARWVAGGCVLMLVIVPACWVAASRTLDLLALNLGLNALLITGYFLLGTTAWHLPESATGILKSGSLVVLINALGFGCFFATVGTSYAIAALRAARIPPLPAPPAELDRRLAWALRTSAFLTLLVICLPMASSGVIPMLADDPVEARLAMVRSDAARSLYLAGSAVLPFIAGGLITLILRRPLRLMGVDGWLAGGIVLVQILTSNRLPLAITLFVTASLLTIERRFPRWMLVAMLAGFLFIYAGLSGFTAIFRQEKQLLNRGNIVQTSLEQAFLGDNLIDLRDAAWVFSHWDFKPLEGRTYLGGAAAFVPSGVFPQKKEWHLGLTGLRIVGWDTSEHFGLRITFFGEAFLNFGPGGVMMLGVMMGGMYGPLLRRLHLSAKKRPPCLHSSLRIIILMQLFLPLSNTSDGYMLWAMAAFLILLWLVIDLPLLLADHPPDVPAYAPSRA